MKANCFLAPLRLCVIFLFCLVALMGVARAGEASASATLSSDTASVGEEVQLQITVQGTDCKQVPEVRVDGMQIRYAGQSRQSSFQMLNGKIESTSSHIYTYSVLPKKEGTFTIPAIAVDAGGKKLSTEPLTLTVGAGAGAGAGASGGAAAEARFVFAEWVLPKAAAYVGEAIPVELRLYVDDRVQCQLPQMPSASGDGFTVPKFAKPQQCKVTREGRTFVLAIFKTAITPVKAGKLPLPSAEINAVAVLPAKRQRTPKMPGVDDFFNDPFFNGAFNTQQQVTIRPEAAELEVKPLPVEGRPDHFSGAVGEFTLETKAAPLRVRAGDPVTVTAVVKGVGSFDRMNAPTLAEEPGWRIYPPSGKFQADDEAGISGSKTFEIAAIPETTQTALPRLEFWFFNPSTGNYERLAGDPIPLTVEGAPAAAPVAAAGTPAATPAATPPPVASDIQYIRVDPGRWGVTFEPAWRTRAFWAAQLVPLSALLLLGGWQWRQARQGDGMRRRLAALRQAKADALRVLREEPDPGKFYEAAMRVLQLETALGAPASDRVPAVIDAEAACASRALDGETAEGVRRIFAAHDELRYAGVGARGSGAIPTDQREQVLQTVAQFEKSHA